MNFELGIHLFIDLVVTSAILYFLLRHIRETEKFYEESRIEWYRQKENDKLLEIKLDNYLREKSDVIKSKMSLIAKDDDKLKNQTENLITNYLANISSVSKQKK